MSQFGQRAYVLAAIVALAITGACQSQQTAGVTGSPNQPNESSTRESAHFANQAPPSPADTSTNPPSEGAASVTENVSSPNDATAEQPAAKTYKMNKNYDIVPIAPDGNKKVVLLTFDDGPKDKEQIEQLTAALDKHKAKAIFFVNGYRVQKHPELLKLIKEKGQTIGNHSWDHIDLKKEKDETVDKQIKDVQQIVRDTIGESPKFFRPPFGSSSDYVKKLVQDEGMLFMTWSNGSEDWLTTNQKPEGVIKRVLEQLHGGSNILMHELPWTAEALDDLLAKLEEKGYTFVDPDTIDTTLSPFG